MSNVPYPRVSGFFFALLALAACEEGLTTNEPATVEPGEVLQEEVTEIRVVERPDIFSTTELGLWDGRPTLGRGAWVAHPDVTDPEGVRVRNMVNGQTIRAALYRRERLSPGPRIQLSSTAAEELGILAGQPVELEVVVVRDEEVVIQPALLAPAAVAASEDGEDPVEGESVSEDARGVEAEVSGMDPSGAIVPVTAAGSAAALAAISENPNAETAVDAAEVAEMADVAEATETTKAPSSSIDPSGAIVPVTAASAATALALASNTEVEEPDFWEQFRDSMVRETPEAKAALTAITAAAASPATAESAASPEVETEPLAAIAAATVALDAVEAEETAAAGASDLIVSENVPNTLQNPFIQIGLYSQEPNASAASSALRQAGIVPTVSEGSGANGAFWRVLIGPVTNAEDQTALLEQVKSLGYTDAYLTQN